MNSFFLYLPFNGTMVAIFLATVVGINFFAIQLEHSGYRSPILYRWVVIFVITLITSIPNENIISASNHSIKKAIDCVNETKNIRLKKYMKSELARKNVREYKVERVLRQCYSEKYESEILQKRMKQSQTLF
jgi:hypothetical protein